MLELFSTRRIATVTAVATIAFGSVALAIPAAWAHGGWDRGGGGSGTRISAPEGAFGTVASVDGSTTPGQCGTAGDTTGTFTLTGYKSSTTWTVDLTSSTTFVDPGVSSPSFADVCVGDQAGAIGTVSGSDVTASKVFVAAVTEPPAPRGAFGTVASVDGSTTPGQCGTAGDTTGSFTLETWRDTATWTVDLTSSTTFVERGVSSASFADVCVGGLVGATGNVSGNTVTASKVFVTPPPPQGAFGTVASVDGSTTPGQCGTAGDTTGTFTLTGYKSSTTWTVDLTSSTTFVDPGVSSPSFADVCVGDQTGAIGSVSGSDVTASKVFITPVRTPPPLPQGAFGTVASVDGSTTPGQCGTAGDPTGTFTVETWKDTVTWTVDLTSSTTFLEPGTSSASFADVCVGGLVGASGTVSGNTVTASDVFIAPSSGSTTSVPPFWHDPGSGRGTGRGHRR